MDWDFQKTDWYVVTPLGNPPSPQDTFTDMRPETSSWKFGFIQRDDKGRSTTVKDLESRRFER